MGRGYCNFQKDFALSLILHCICDFLHHMVKEKKKSIKSLENAKTLDMQASRLECIIKKITFLFLNQNICCGYSKEPSH